MWSGTGVWKPQTEAEMDEEAPDAAAADMEHWGWVRQCSEKFGTRLLLLQYFLIVFS